MIRYRVHKQNGQWLVRRGTHYFAAVVGIFNDYDLAQLRAKRFARHTKPCGAFIREANLPGYCMMCCYKEVEH